MESAISIVGLITSATAFSILSAFLGTTLISFIITAFALEIVYFIYWLYLTKIDVPLEVYVWARLLGLLVSFGVFILVKVAILDLKRRKG